MNKIVEGLAKVNFPKSVFYNPVQEFNRDITISIINTFYNISKNDIKPKINFNSGINILEALSATGLRSVRFAKEITNVGKIIANDIDPIAAELIKENVKLNECGDKIDISCSDANYFMYKSKAEEKKFHVVDLDPYGSASRFIDAAVQSVTPGGLLCVTCTDAAVLCGSARGTSMGKYGAMNPGNKSASCHEIGIRILLQTIAASAGRYGLYIEPVLSLSVDFYFRVFVRIYEGQGVVKSLSSKLGMVYVCNGCSIHHIQPLGNSEPTGDSNVNVTCSLGPPVGRRCDSCNSTFILGGPMWIAPIHNVNFCKNLVSNLQSVDKLSSGIIQTPNTIKRIIGMVALAIEELEDYPLYYETDKLCKVVNSITPPAVEFRSAILNAGYKVSSTHCNSSALKTNAPGEFIWSTIKEFMRRNNVDKIQKVLDGTKLQPAGRHILLKQHAFESEINFNEHKDAHPPSKLQKLLRFQPNPTPNWGPKPKACRYATENDS